MKNYTLDLSINHDKSYIIGTWNIPEPTDIFLGDCAMAFPFHVLDDLNFEITSYDKYSSEFISTFRRNISILSLEELVLVIISKKELSFSGSGIVFVMVDFV